MTYASGRQVATNRLARRVVKHLTHKQTHREGETSVKKQTKKTETGRQVIKTDQKIERKPETDKAHRASKI